jgi:hypothetical protein
MITANQATGLSKEGAAANARVEEGRYLLLCKDVETAIKESTCCGKFGACVKIDPELAIRLIELLRQNGFSVMPSYNNRSIVIEWGPGNELA